MKSSGRLLLGGILLGAIQAQAHGPQPMSLKNVPLPPVPGLLDGSSPIVVNQAAAIQLGKALFWDVNVGSDGMACGSCHFHAGADRRVKNQLNPGAKSSQPSGQVFAPLPTGPTSGGANYALRVGDFPTFQYSNPLCRPIPAINFTCSYYGLAEGVLTFSTDDVVSSSGTFSGTFNNTSRFTGTSDDCTHSADPVFHVNSTRTRRVEPRNAPTVFNAIFNYRNFWDGRANNIFNGSSPWGERDPNAGVWVKINARTVQKQRLHLINSALASLATAPPLSDSEMACQQRNWPDIGRKLLLRQPLQHQKVHNEDSVLGSLSSSSPGNLQPGLSTTYKQLIMQAFSPKYWSYAGTGFIPGRPGQAPYNQMEANFAMYFGLALQLYQATLVSDDAPIDRTDRHPVTGVPTWQGLGYDAAKIARLTDGASKFINNHCNLCHAGPALTTAAIVPNTTLVTPTPGATYGPPNALVPYGPNALGYDYLTPGAYAVGINRYINVLSRDNIGAAGGSGGGKLHDMGFTNTGVGNPADDPGLGGFDDFGNPLSFSEQYKQYLLGNTVGMVDPGINTIRSCDFVEPVAWDVPFSDNGIFTAPDGLEIDGNREGVLRNQNCVNQTAGDDPNGPFTTARIPTVAAANYALANKPAKLALAVEAAFKIPSLRNVELTGPYMHNGSMATLDQVVEFYARHANIDSALKFNLINSTTLSTSVTAAQDRANVKEFLLALTDERVRYEQAPFDHPEIAVPHGHPGDNQSVTPGNPIDGALADDDYLVVPAVGAGGSTQPLASFDTFLAP